MRNATQVHLLGALSFALVVGVAPAPDSPVADAAMHGDIERVRTLLRSGADVNAAQGDGMTALHWSAMRNEVSVMEILLYAGATPQSTTRLGGYTPLHLASREGHAGAIQTLLESGANAATFTTTGAAAIHLAAEAGDPEAVQALLDHGADPNALDEFGGRTPLIFATARNRLEVMETLVLGGADVTLATAVKDYPAMERVDGRERSRHRRIRQAARDPQPRPQTQRPPTPAGANQAAAQPGTPGAALTPPDSAATPPDSAATPPDSAAPHPATPEPDPDPDRPTTPPEPDRPTEPDTTPATPAAREPRPMSYTDLVGRQGGFTALHYAARDGLVDAAALLLDAGVDVNHLTEGDGSTPMLVAIINGNFDLAMMFLDRGGDANLASEDGAGPLFAAINNEWALRTWYPQPSASRQQKTSYLDLMKALLDAGADPDARLGQHLWYAAYNAGRMGVDFSGATAFWRAAYATDVSAMRLLVEYGADPNIRTRKPPSRRRPGIPGAGQDTTQRDEDPSGMPPVPTGGPAVHALHAASGVGYGTSRVGQQHRHVPDGWLPAVRYLVEELGVDVNVRDHDGYSAIHNAAARGDNPVIQFLVDHGADVTFVSRRGQTTVDMANGPQQRVQPFPETIALLEGLGAKNNDNCLSCE